MGRWAEASRTPTAGDLHWGGGLPGSRSQVVLWGTQKQRFHPEGTVLGLLRSGRRPHLQGPPPQRDMTSRKTWPPGDITSKASLGGATGIDHILHFDKMILCLQSSVTFFCPHSFLKVGPDLGQNGAAALSPESDSSLSSQEAPCSPWP